MAESQETNSGMRPAVKGLIVLVVVVAAVLIYSFKESGKGNTPAPPKAGEPSTLPRLVDLGRGKCVPCKMMKPVLEALRAEFADQFRTVYIDLTKSPEASAQYRIKTIPTQIFYDVEGKELYRHVGFLSKADIIAKWNELGYPFVSLEDIPEEDMKIIGGGDE